MRPYATLVLAWLVGLGLADSIFRDYDGTIYERDLSEAFDLGIILRNHDQEALTSQIHARTPKGGGMRYKPKGNKDKNFCKQDVSRMKHSADPVPAPDGLFLGTKPMPKGDTQAALAHLKADIWNNMLNAGERACFANFPDIEALGDGLVRDKDKPKKKCDVEDDDIADAPLVLRKEGNFKDGCWISRDKKGFSYTLNVKEKPPGAHWQEGCGEGDRKAQVEKRDKERAQKQLDAQRKKAKNELGKIKDCQWKINRFCANQNNQVQGYGRRSGGADFANFMWDSITEKEMNGACPGSIHQKALATECYDKAP